MKKFPGFLIALPQIKVPINGVDDHLMQSQNNQIIFFEFKDDTKISTQFTRCSMRYCGGWQNRIIH